MRLYASIALLSLAFSAPAVMSAEILIHDEKSRPESLTIASDSAVMAGGASLPYVGRITNCATTTEVFAGTSTDGRRIFFFGQLADPATNIWRTCRLMPVPA
jgi:hypothetical protein